MLRIRMLRMGRKRQPFYRLVVVPRGNKAGRGRYVEKIGWVDPLQHSKHIDADRAKHWLSVGAQPSNSVWNLFVREGIIEGEKRRKGTTKTKKEQPAAPEAAANEAPADAEKSTTDEAQGAEATAEDAEVAEQAKEETPEAEEAEKKEEGE